LVVKNTVIAIIIDIPTFFIPNKQILLHDIFIPIDLDAGSEVFLHQVGISQIFIAGYIDAITAIGFEAVFPDGSGQAKEAEKAKSRDIMPKFRLTNTKP
jgi:hypothetical protein